MNQEPQRTARGASLRARPERSGPRPWSPEDLVSQLHEAGDVLGGRSGRLLGRRALPARETLVDIVAALRAALFPAHFGPAELTRENLDDFVGRTADDALGALHEQVRRGLHFACAHDGSDCPRCERDAGGITRAFARALPAARALLVEDVRAAYEGDPAATSLDEAILCYPGVTAITHHRLAHLLHTLDVPLIPRMISEISHGATGIDIHPGAAIGGSFFIDHGTGVVIGETCRIGARVRLYQGVTLGAKSFGLDAQGRAVKGAARHPVVEDDVVIYAGATILGRVTIGRGSSVGGNVWLTRDVPPQSRVTQVQAQSAVFQDGAGI